jgi:hypothetical protein
LITIWYEYVYSLLFPRVANLRDNIFPYLFGVFQIILSYFINNPRKWLFFTSTIGLLGFLAYKNARDKLVKADYSGAINRYFQKFQSKKMTSMILLVFILFLFRCMYETPLCKNDLPLGITVIDILFAPIFVSCLSVNLFMSRRFYIDLKNIEKKEEKNLLQKHCKWDDKLWGFEECLEKYGKFLRLVDGELERPDKKIKGKPLNSNF